MSSAFKESERGYPIHNISISLTVERIEEIRRNKSKLEIDLLCVSFRTHQLLAAYSKLYYVDHGIKDTDLFPKHQVTTIVNLIADEI